MKCISAKEFAMELDGREININSVDTYGISLNMSKAKVTYDESMDELSFTAGSHCSADGIATVSFEVGALIEYVLFDETRGVYTIGLTWYAPELEVRKAV